MSADATIPSHYHYHYEVDSDDEDDDSTDGNRASSSNNSKVNVNDYSIYGFWGNVVNGIVFLLALAYALSVLYYTHPDQQDATTTQLFDSQWLQDGFCIQHKDVPYWSSFDTCLYVDVIGCAILALLFALWHKRPGMKIRANELVWFVILGTLGHGIAHGFMAYELRQRQEESIAAAERFLSDNTDPNATAADEELKSGTVNGTSQNSIDNDIPDHPAWQMVVFWLIFWFPLLKASMIRMKTYKVLLFSAIVTYGNTFVRKQHGFMYVQTILAICFHTSELFLTPSIGKKSNGKYCYEYFTLPLMVGALPVIVAWCEALFCTTWFERMGGHMLYDASIILSFIIYYIDAYRYRSALEDRIIKAKTRGSTIFTPQGQRRSRRLAKKED